MDTVVGHCGLQKGKGGTLAGGIVGTFVDHYGLQMQEQALFLNARADGNAIQSNKVRMTPRPKNGRAKGHEERRKGAASPVDCPPRTGIVGRKSPPSRAEAVPFGHGGQRTAWPPLTGAICWVRSPLTGKGYHGGRGRCRRRPRRKICAWWPSSV